MTAFVTILIFLAILFVVIVVHELGHFFAAKLTGVRVVELGLGYPPRLFGKRWGDTIYLINALPLGGFCKMVGEDDPDIPGSLAARSKRVRLFALSAGSIAMLLLPVFLFPVAYMIPVERYIEGDGIRVAAIVAESPADYAGLEVGDTILGVDGVAVNSFEDMHQAVDPKVGTEVTLLVLRQPDDQFEVIVVPRVEYPEDQGPLGITMTVLTETTGYPLWRAVPMGLAEYGRLWVLMKDAVVELVRGPEMPEGWEGPPIAGPIGIAQLTGAFASSGAYPLIWFACFLSVNLAIVNLLPVPALDGGRIIFVLLEAVRRGKRISAQTEGAIHTFGFALLILLVVVISYYDVVRLVHGGGILP